MKPKLILSLLLLLICNLNFAQIQEYTYKREIKDVQETWHKMVLPNEIFGKLETDFSDLKIVGITAENDTIEAPYILNITSEAAAEKRVGFKLINSVSNENGYFFTFEIPTEEAINELKLDFQNQNFDWKINLQGSNNQQEWFDILEDYRILSIKNELTDFQFTNLKFPIIKFRYFRLYIPDGEKPELEKASVLLQENLKGNFRSYETQQINRFEENKTSVIDVQLENPVPVSYLRLNFADTIDYYRPLKIKFRPDSIMTEKGVKYNYRTLASGTLNSVSINEFHFKSTILSHLRIEIQNFDNEPLQILTNIEVKGPEHELFIRFSTPAKYFLIYGNKNARKPIYDIENFQQNIPENLQKVSFSAEEQISEAKNSENEPLFINKWWLWAIMLLIILIMGAFAIKMMKSPKKG